MAKKIKKQEEEEIKTEEDLPASEDKKDSEKVFIGYHPITGEEVWQ